MSSAALKSLPYITQAGGWYTNSGGTLSNLFNPRLLRQDEKRYMIKIDQAISDKNRVNFRYNDSPTVKTQFTPSSPISATAEYNYAKQYKLQDTHTMSRGLSPVRTAFRICVEPGATRQIAPDHARRLWTLARSRDR